MFDDRSEAQRCFSTSRRPLSMTSDDPNYSYKINDSHKNLYGTICNLWSILHLLMSKLRYMIRDLQTLCLPNYDTVHLPWMVTIFILSTVGYSLFLRLLTSRCCLDKRRMWYYFVRSAFPPVITSRAALLIASDFGLVLFDEVWYFRSTEWRMFFIYIIEHPWIYNSFICSSCSVPENSLSELNIYEYMTALFVVHIMS